MDLNMVMYLTMMYLTTVMDNVHWTCMTMVMNINTVTDLNMVMDMTTVIDLTMVMDMTMVMYRNIDQGDR